MTSKRKRNIIFQVRDPKGNIVTLTRGAYKGHILIRHPETGLFLESLKQTINEPDRIVQDRYGAYHYYRKITSEIKEFFSPTASYFWVCVKKVEKGELIVFTYEAVDKLKKGKLIWEKD